VANKLPYDTHAKWKTRPDTSKSEEGMGK